MNLSAPSITNEDRARGFAELDLQLNDGTRQSVRVHALSPVDFINAAHLSDRAALHDLLVQVLRESPDWVREKVSPLAQMQIMQTLAMLVCPDGEALIETAAQQALAATTTPKEIETMNQMIQAPAVTPEDVLAGTKTFPVRTRKGEEKTITVKRLSWRTGLRVSYALSEGKVLEAVTAALADQAKPLCEDAFLDEIAPAHLVPIATVALWLSNGVDDANARLANLDEPAS